MLPFTRHNVERWYEVKIGPDLPGISGKCWSLGAALEIAVRHIDAGHRERTCTIWEAEGRNGFAAPRPYRH
jgi:hypothetical protein